MTAETTIPTIVLGGSGYVAGELLRLLTFHPNLQVAGILSTTQAGEPVEKSFPHLAGSYPDTRFTSSDELTSLLDTITVAGSGREKPGGNLAIFSAAPHGASAPLLDALLHSAADANLDAHAVDLSADFRYADVSAYTRVYGHAHGAPGRLADFTSALPEHLTTSPTPHIGHPGCFVTSVLLAAVPLLRAGIVEPDLFVSAITGSTGAGRNLTATTHHPERRSNLFAYQPLAHRHEPEMRALAAAASGVEAAIHFVPHAGPFARGIHMTLGARTALTITGEDARAAVAAAYAGAPFVQVTAQPPRLQDVVGTNRCHLHIEVRDGTLVALAVLDNLIKGAAGGGIQWMNRLLDLPETTGLLQPGLGWI